MANRNSPRLTHQSLKVLQVFMEKPRDAFSGADIRRKTQLISGTLYPILLRFEDAGILTSKWEEADPRELGRPRKRLYTITGDGINVASDAFRYLGLTPGEWVWT